MSGLLSVRPELVEGLSFLTPAVEVQGFNKLSQNGDFPASNGLVA